MPLKIYYTSFPFVPGCQTCKCKRSSRTEQKSQVRNVHALLDITSWAYSDEYSVKSVRCWLTVWAFSINSPIVHVVAMLGSIAAPFRDWSKFGTKLRSICTIQRTRSVWMLDTYGSTKHNQNVWLVSAYAIVHRIRTRMVSSSINFGNVNSKQYLGIISVIRLKMSLFYLTLCSLAFTFLNY